MQKRNSFNDWFPSVEVRHVFSSYQCEHVYADLYNVLSSLKLQFQRFLQMQMSYHSFNGQARERFYGNAPINVKPEGGELGIGWGF